MTATARRWWPARAVARIPVIARAVGPAAPARSRPAARPLAAVAPGRGGPGLLSTWPTADATSPLIIAGTLADRARRARSSPRWPSGRWPRRRPAAGRRPAGAPRPGPLPGPSGAALAAISLALASPSAVVVIATAADAGGRRGQPVRPPGLLFRVGDGEPVRCPDAAAGRASRTLGRPRSTVRRHARRTPRSSPWTWPSTPPPLDHEHGRRPVDRHGARSSSGSATGYGPRTTGIPSTWPPRRSSDASASTPDRRRRPRADCRETDRRPHRLQRQGRDHDDADRHRRRIPTAGVLAVPTRSSARLPPRRGLGPPGRLARRDRPRPDRRPASPRPATWPSTTGLTVETRDDRTSLTATADRGHGRPACSWPWASWP